MEEHMTKNHKIMEYGQILMGEAYLVPNHIGRASNLTPTGREEMTLYNDQLKMWGFPHKIVHGDDLLQLAIHNYDGKDWCNHGAPTSVVQYFFGENSPRIPFPTIFPAKAFVGNKEGSLISFDLEPSTGKYVALFLVLGQRKSYYGSYGKFEDVLKRVIY